MPLQWAHVVMIALAVPPQWRPAPHPTARAYAAKALKLGHYPLVDTYLQTLVNCLLLMMVPMSVFSSSGSPILVAG